MAKFTYTPPNLGLTLFYDNVKKEFHSEYYPSFSFEFSDKKTFLESITNAIVKIKPKIPLYFSHATIKIEKTEEESPAKPVFASVRMAEIIQAVKQEAGNDYPLNIGWYTDPNEDSFESIYLSVDGVQLYISVPMHMEIYKAFSNLTMLTDKSDSNYNEVLHSIRNNRDTIGKIFGIIATRNATISDELNGLNFFFADYSPYMIKNIATSGYFSWNIPAEFFPTNGTGNRIILPQGQAADQFFNINIVAKDYCEKYFKRGIKVGVTGYQRESTLRVLFTSDTPINFLNEEDSFDLDEFNGAENKITFDITQCVGGAEGLPQEWLTKHHRKLLRWIPASSPPMANAMAKRRLVFNPLTNKFDYITDVSNIEEKITELIEEVKCLKQIKKATV